MTLLQTDMVLKDKFYTGVMEESTEDVLKLAQ
jgi:hypothetical protein